MAVKSWLTDGMVQIKEMLSQPELWSIPIHINATFGSSINFKMMSIALYYVQTLVVPITSIIGFLMPKLNLQMARVSEFT